MRSSSSVLCEHIDTIQYPSSEILRMGGLEPEDAYPYKAKNGTCHLVRQEIAVYINDSVEIPRNETIMEAWVALKGPLSVGEPFFLRQNR